MGSAAASGSGYGLASAYTSAAAVWLMDGCPISATASISRSHAPADGFETGGFGFGSIYPVTPPYSSSRSWILDQAHNDNATSQFSIACGDNSVFYSGTCSVTWDDSYVAVAPYTPTAVTVQNTTGNITTLTPTIQATFNDFNIPIGDKPLYLQIQVRRVSDSVLMWDTGKVATTSAEQISRAVTTRTYGGGSLAYNTQYSLIIKFWDITDQESPWCAAITFTPVTAPAPPTLTAPAGKIDTLTPTLTGTYNIGSGAQPMDAFNAVVTDQSGVTVWDAGMVAASGTTFSLLYAGPTLALGTPYAWKARARNTNGVWGEFATLLPFRTNALPVAPALVSPANGAGVSSTPLLRWSPSDPDLDLQTEATVDVRLASTGVSASGFPHVVAGNVVSYAVPSGAGLVVGTAYQWTVKTKDNVGYGPYAAVRTFTPNNGPTVTVTAPANGSTISVPNPTVIWTYAAGGGGAQTQARVKIKQGLTLIFDSGALAGAGTSYTIPVGYIHAGQLYTATVSAIDTLATEGVSAPNSFTTAWTPPASITGLITTVDQQHAWIALQWDAVTTAFTDFLYYAAYYRAQGTAAWTRFAKITNRSTTTAVFATPASGVVYEFSVAQAVNYLSEPNESLLGAVAQYVTWEKGVFLSDATNPTRTQVQLRTYQSRALTQERDSVRYVTWGRTRPVSHVGPQHWQRAEFDLKVLKGEETTLAGIEALFAARHTLCYRDARGRRFFGDFGDSGNAGLQEDDQFPFNYILKAVIVETEFTEA